jgi:hypothetical protein
MSWTYDPTQLGTSKMMQVRLLVGDTKPTDQQVQDEEINFALTQRANIYGAAAIICRSLSSQLSREADTVDKDLRTTLSQRATAYGKQAAAYEVKASVRGGGLPYAGGLSIADKIMNEANTDRVQPQFSIDMDDNYLPVAPVGNEGTPQPTTSNQTGNG